MDSNDRAWMASRNSISQEYTDRLNNFLATARHHLDSDGRTLCPCTRCENTWLQRLPTIQAHILQYGMLATYRRWIHHGESPTDEKEDDHFEDSSNIDEDDHTLRDAIVDEGRMFFNVERSTENDVRSNSTSSQHSIGASGRLILTEVSASLASVKSELASVESKFASAKSEFASIKYKLFLIEGELAELLQKVRSIVSGQSRPSFFSLLNVRDQGSETRER